MNAEPALYLDSSAIVKLVRREPETAALTELLIARSRLVTSALSAVEVMRAAHRVGDGAPVVAATALSRLARIPISMTIIERAGALLPNAALRSLDAIHLSSALLIPDLEALVTYDNRQADAAAQLGLQVRSPGT